MFPIVHFGVWISRKALLGGNKWGLKIVDLALNPNQTLQTDT